MSTPPDGTTFTREDGSSGVWVNGLPRTAEPETRVTMDGCYWGILAEFGLIDRLKFSALYAAANDRSVVTFHLNDEEINAIRASVPAGHLDTVGFPEVRES